MVTHSDLFNTLFKSDVKFCSTCESPAYDSITLSLSGVTGFLAGLFFTH